jgi:hypothetical protein
VDDRTDQIANLARIFDEGARAPIFRAHPGHPVKGVPRIAYGDVMDFKCVIRDDEGFSANPFWNEEARVVAQYATIEALVDDGWRLD